MPNGRITAHPFRRPHRKHRRWQRHPDRYGSRKRRCAQRQRPPRPYRLSQFSAAYVAALSVCVTATGVLAHSGEAAALPFIGIVYLGCGITLSRFFHHRVRWLHWKASVAVVAQVKVRTIVSWPVSVPVFIAQVCFAKHF